MPAEALIFNRDGLQVAVVNNGKAEIRKVRVARDLGTQRQLGPAYCRRWRFDRDMLIGGPWLKWVDEAAISPLLPSGSGSDGQDETA